MNTKNNFFNVTNEGYRISSVTYNENGVKSITINGGDANRNYSYEVTLTDEGLTVKPSILPKWHGAPIIAEESDEPKVGDKCIFWNDNSKIFAIDTLKKGDENIVSYNDGRKFLWVVNNNYFKNCTKYSDKKLIEIVNKLWQK